MDIFTALLAVNWLEQKSQGEKIREAILRANPPLPVDRAAIDAELAAIEADPKTFMSWCHRKGLFNLIRISFFGMTKREKEESQRAWEYQANMFRPRRP